jgi:hypothetical protein
VVNAAEPAPAVEPAPKPVEASNTATAVTPKVSATDGAFGPDYEPPPADGTKPQH